MAITKEQIFQVADELNAAGQNPTLAAIRKALDGGSYTTISEAMKEWREMQDTTPVQETLPEAMKEKIMVLGREAWNTAVAMANERLAAERKALETARESLEIAKEEAVELADSLANELDAIKAALDAAQGQIQSLHAEKDRLQGELSTATARATVAEARSTEIERRAEELRHELDHAHALYEKAQKAEANAREEAALLRGQIEKKEHKK